MPQGSLSLSNRLGSAGRVLCIVEYVGGSSNKLGMLLEGKGLVG